MVKCIICECPDYRPYLTIDSFDIVTCKNCGLAYLRNPSPVANDLETYNNYFRNATANYYHKDAANAALRTLWQINEQRLRWIQQAKPEGSLLDVGSGRGEFLSHASQSGYEATGVEISPIAAAFCEAHYHIKTYVQNIEQQPLHGRKYDVITMWHVLEHFRNPLKVLQQIRDRMNDAGFLFIEVPNIESLKFKLSPRTTKFLGGNHPRHHRFFFSKNTLSLLLIKAGFSQVHFMFRSYRLAHQNVMQSITKQLLKMVHRDSFVDVWVKK